MIDTRRFEPKISRLVLPQSLLGSKSATFGWSTLRQNGKWTRDEEQNWGGGEKRAGQCHFMLLPGYNMLEGEGLDSREGKCSIGNRWQAH
jgi:hypothetical protein